MNIYMIATYKHSQFLRTYVLSQRFPVVSLSRLPRKAPNNIVFYQKFHMLPNSATPAKYPRMDDIMIPPHYKKQHPNQPSHPLPGYRSAGRFH